MTIPFSDVPFHIQEGLYHSKINFIKLTKSYCKIGSDRLEKKVYQIVGDRGKQLLFRLVNLDDEKDVEAVFRYHQEYKILQAPPTVLQPTRALIK